MSGDKNKRERTTRSSIKCDECSRYFLTKEAVDSHKIQFHVTKKGVTTAKITPAKTSSHESKPSKTNTGPGGIKLTKVSSPVPENVSKIAKTLIAASKNALTKQNSSSEASTNSPTTKNVAQNDESKNGSPLNGKPLKEEEIITELSSNAVAIAIKPQSTKRPTPVSFKNIGFKCPKCAQHFSSYFVALKHIEKRHCTSKGEVDKALIETIKPIRMGECIQCNEYFSLSTSHTCALRRVKTAFTTTVNMLSNEVTISPTNQAENTVKTYTNIKKYINPNTSIKKDVQSPQVARIKRFSDEVETSVDPIAISEEDEVDPTKLMYVKRNSEFKCWGCQRTFINFDGFNLHVMQNHYDDAEIFFVDDTQDFHQLSTLIKNKSGANYKMLEMSSQTPGYYFLQCQSRPLIDKSGIAYYCPSSLILEKFGNIYIVAYCKKHYCSTKQMTQIVSAESLLNKKKTDLYLQFKNITESVILEAAKVKVGKLSELNVKAKEFAKYLHKINIKDEPGRNLNTNTIQGLHLDEIIEFKEDVKPTKRKITFSDELKPVSNKRKKQSKLNVNNREQSPVHQTITTNVVIENHSPKIMNTIKKDSPTISVKSVESLNSSVTNKLLVPKEEVPASFSETYESFLKKSKSETMYLGQEKYIIRTKLGQFSPKNKDTKSDRSDSKKKKKPKTEKSDSETDSKTNIKSVTFSPIINETKMKPKSNLAKMTTGKIKPRFVAKKSTTSAMRNTTRNNVLSLKSSDMTPESKTMSPESKIMSPKPNILVKSKSPVVASPKVCVKYEVKEQENDCNILILKI